MINQLWVHLSFWNSEFHNYVLNGHLGKTGKFWLSFMDQLKLILLLIYAVKTNKRNFHWCNIEMAVTWHGFKYLL